MANNIKRTRGSNFYYQIVSEKVKDIYDSRIVKIRKGFMMRLLVRLNIISIWKLAKRKTIKVGEVWEDPRESNQLIKLSRAK